MVICIVDIWTSGNSFELKKKILYSHFNSQYKCASYDLCHTLTSHSTLCFHDQDDRADALVNGKAGKYVPVPQKSLPNLPPPRAVSDYQLDFIRVDYHVK